MKFETNAIGGSVEILASKDFQAIPAKIVAGDGAETTVVKAGTPITADGAGTTGAGAVGVLLYDVDTAENPKGALVVQGIIDAVKAQAHSGVTYVSVLYSALPGIVFRTNIGAQGETGET